MSDELTADERAQIASGALGNLRRQIFQARIDKAANVGDDAAVAELNKRLTQLRAGYANVESVFAADLAHAADVKGLPDATG